MLIILSGLFLINDSNQTNWLEIFSDEVNINQNMAYASSNSTSGWIPHIHDEIEVTVNSEKSFFINMKDREITNISTNVGDRIDITISVGDDLGVKQISPVKLITNFAKKPSDMNLYYGTNHNGDSGRLTGLSVYEWYSDKTDLKYDYDGTLSWHDATVKEQERDKTNHDYVGFLPFNEKELLITYSITMNGLMEKTQVTTKITDSSYLHKNIVLPFTIETFEKQEPIVEEPIVEEPIVEEPIVEEPIVEEPIVEEPIVEEPIVEEPIVEEPIVEEPIVEEPIVEEPIVEEPIVEEPIVEEPIVEEPIVEEPKKLGVASFVDVSKDPQSYVDRYTNEPIYKEWFDENYSQYSSIYQAVGLEEPVVEPVVEMTLTPKCGDGTEDVNGICQVMQIEEKSSKGGGCLIATATYDSEMSPQVQLLREIRDNQLMNTASGTAFMSTFNDVYYSFSPTIADMERENPMFKEAVKVAITPMLSTLSLMENAESESEVLSIGISIIVLNLAMYLGVPAVMIVGIKKIK